MVKVIVGYRVKQGADIRPILVKLRSHAITYPGFIGAENLQGQTDISIVAMLQTWNKVEDWRAWETSRTRSSILRDAEPLLVEEPRVTIYRVMSTGWE